MSTPYKVLYICCKKINKTFNHMQSNTISVCSVCWPKFPEIWIHAYEKIYSWYFDRNLDHLPIMSHICVIEPGSHWFKWCFVVFSSQKPLYKWMKTSRQADPMEQIFKKNRNWPIFIEEIRFCNWATILSRGDDSIWQKYDNGSSTERDGLYFGIIISTLKQE